MTLIMRKFEFDYGHRVLKHESKCKHIHGHRGVAEVYVKSGQLDPLGRVLDYGVIKQRVGEWIDARWDHNLLLNSEDPLHDLWLKLTHSSKYEERNSLFGGKSPFVFAYQNPTAENMAEYLYRTCVGLLPEVSVVKVRLWETPNCWAEFPA